VAKNSGNNIRGPTIGIMGSHIPCNLLKIGGDLILCLFCQRELCIQAVSLITFLSFAREKEQKKKDSIL